MNEDGQYWCKNCIKYHYVKTGERIPLVISSSTLAGWRVDPEVFDLEGDDFHIDWDLCRGAKIRTAIHSTLAQYSRSEYPVDAFIILGLNDFLEGSTVSRIWQNLTKLSSLVRTIAPNHWTGPSTAALGTVLTAHAPHPMQVHHLRSSTPAHTPRRYEARHHDHQKKDWQIQQQLSPIQVQYIHCSCQISHIRCQVQKK